MSHVSMSWTSVEEEVTSTSCLVAFSRHPHVSICVIWLVRCMCKICNMKCNMNHKMSHVIVCNVSYVRLSKCWCARKGLGAALGMRHASMVSHDDMCLSHTHVSHVSHVSHVPHVSHDTCTSHTWYTHMWRWHSRLTPTSLTPHLVWHPLVSHLTL